MTTSIALLGLWLANWFIMNTEYNCYCINEGRDRQICKCELEMKKGVKP